MSDKPDPHPWGALDELLGIMLETWEHRYNFNFDRVARRIEFSRPDITIVTEEIPNGQIRVSIVDQGRLLTRCGGPVDSASAIEGAMLASAADPERNKQLHAQKLKPWWKFWN